MCWCMFNKLCNCKTNGNKISHLVSSSCLFLSSTPPPPSLAVAGCVAHWPVSSTTAYLARSVISPASVRHCELLDRLFLTAHTRQSRASLWAPSRLRFAFVCDLQNYWVENPPFTPICLAAQQVVVADGRNAHWLIHSALTFVWMEFSCEHRGCCVHVSSCQPVWTPLCARVFNHVRQTATSSRFSVVHARARQRGAARQPAGALLAGKRPVMRRHFTPLK